MVLEILSMILEFFSNNAVIIALVVLLIAFKEPISGLISRFTSIRYKSKKAELDMRTAGPYEEQYKDESLGRADEKPSLEDKKNEVQPEEVNLLPEMYKAFEEGRLEDAEEFFEKYSSEENDEEKLDCNKAIYLYLRFEKGKDDSAIQELEQLSKIAKTESSKYQILNWLSLCLTDSAQYQKEQDIWRLAVEEMQGELLKTKAIVRLAYALDRSRRVFTILCQRIYSATCWSSRPGKWIIS